MGKQRCEFKIWKPIGKKHLVSPTGTRSLVGRASALDNLEDLGSSLSECQIFYFFPCVLSYALPLRSVGRSNFLRVCINLSTLIQKRHILMRTAVSYVNIYIYLSTELKGPISTGVCKDLTMLIQITTCKFEKFLY